MSRARSENPLTVSQRSNNLQFSRSPHFQSLPSSQFGTRSIYLYTDPRSISAEGRPAKKQYQPNNVRPPPPPPLPSRGEGSPPETYTRRAISSLITPYLPSKRTSKAAHHPHRLSSSASSIRSVTSSIISRKRKYYYEHPTFALLPSEILGEIFSYLDQPTLLSLVKVSRRMVEEAANGLYCQPSFASTYRFAQFVTIVSKNPVLARMVRVLDLSKLGGCVEDDVPLAGWREWKYRDSPLHTIHRDDQVKKTATILHSPSSVRRKKENAAVVTSASLHPLPSPFLQQYSLSRDVPTGALIHLLTACQFLRKLNFSGVPLAADYSVLRTNTSSYTSVAFTGLLFVSDVPKSFTWKEGDTKPLHVTTDLVDAITKLKYLTQLKIKGGLWVTRDAATKLVEECKKLERVDFRECGMYKGNRWAVKGQRNEVRGVLHADREMLLRKRR